MDHTQIGRRSVQVAITALAGIAFLVAADPASTATAADPSSN